MRVYILTNEEFPLEGAQNSVETKSFEANSSLAVIADNFVHGCNFSKRGVDVNAVEWILQGKRQNFSVKMVQKALTEADFGETVCSIDFIDEKKGVRVRRSVMVEDVDYTSPIYPFVGTKQEGRQEVYDFIKDYIKMWSDAEGAISWAATHFDLVE